MLYLHTQPNVMKYKRYKSKIQIYYKCKHCGEFFTSDYAKEYCSRSCRDKFNYNKNKKS